MTGENCSSASRSSIAFGAGSLVVGGGSSNAGISLGFLKQLRLNSTTVESYEVLGGTAGAMSKNGYQVKILFKDGICIVPIHSKIQSIVQKHFEQSKSGYLFEYNGKKLNQSQYREFWADIMDKLQMEHTPHECRHTFRSRLDSAGANKVCIDRLMGHKSKGTGERVYTHKNIEELRLNIELITN